MHQLIGPWTYGLHFCLLHLHVRRDGCINSLAPRHMAYISVYSIYMSDGMDASTHWPLDIWPTFLFTPSTCQTGWMHQLIGPWTYGQHFCLLHLHVRQGGCNGQHFKDDIFKDTFCYSHQTKYVQVRLESWQLLVIHGLCSHWDTVDPPKYAQCLCFILFCCRMVLVILTYLEWSHCQWNNP